MQNPAQGKTQDEVTPPSHPGGTQEVSLPPYFNELDKTTHFLFKPELVDPWTPWPHRRWSRVSIHLQGTCVSIRHASGMLFLRRPLSLQYAQVGLATDYVKRSNVFRLRVEGFQLLVAAGSLGSALEWIEKLSAAALVSIDLDEREEPVDRTLPGAATQTPVVVSDVYPSLLKKWKERRFSKNSVWLEEPQNSDGCLTGLDANRDQQPNTYPRRAHSAASRDNRPRNCVCSTCYNSPRGRDPIPGWFALPTMSHDSEAAERRAAVDSPPTGDSKAPFPSSRDKMAPSSRDINHARRCANTLKFHKSWRLARYVRDRSCVVIGRDAAQDASNSFSATTLPM